MSLLFVAGAIVAGVLLGVGGTLIWLASWLSKAFRR